MQKIRVLIADDSAVMQKILTEILTSDDSIEVIGVANNPYIARELIKKYNPDVLLLDVEMPHMDGVTFLKNIMRLRPMPVIMVSAYTTPGKVMALEALAAGAVDCIGKPSMINGASNYIQELIAMVKNAAQVNIDAFTFLSQQSNKRQLSFVRKQGINSDILKNNIIAIGASTGGIETIEKILVQLPIETPGLVIVQHISKNFAEIFAKRLNELCQLTVMLAKPGQKILPGYVLVAPHDMHLIVKKYQGNYICDLEEGPLIQGHKPSIDILFNSLAEINAARTTALLLTGMGRDGAEGLKAIRRAGGNTIVQDQQSSVVWGMPGAAVKLGAAKYIMSINEIVEYMKNQNYLSQNNGILDQRQGK